MIHRKKPSDPPEKLLDEKWNAIKQDALISKEKHEVDSKCYRDTTIGPLSEIFKNKCAICERQRGTELQVDHYRPKKPRCKKTNTKYNQPGYYWLAYEWINLILLCSKCNQKKSTKFPLLGWSEDNRISSHENSKNINGFNPYDLKWLQNYEKPLMLNPEFEEKIETHFTFKSDCSIEGVSEEGKTTIEICDLKRRDLLREKLEIRKEYVDLIKSAFDDYDLNKNDDELRGELKSVFKRIIINCNEDRPFSLFHLFIYRDFDLFIDKELPSNLRGKATQYFKEYLSCLSPNSTV